LISSVLTKNPTYILLLFNSLQLLAYLPLLNVDVSAKFRSYLLGLSISDLLLNNRKETSEISENPPYERAQLAEIKTSEFISSA